jgi:thiamine biosynthesis lipoprotein
MVKNEKKNIMNAISQTAFFLMLALALAGCGRKESAGRSEFIFGTVCVVRLQQDGKDGVYNRIFARLREIDGIFSVNRAGTVFDNINRMAGVSPVEAPEEALKVLERALFFAEMSDGAFDPTIGPLVKLWGIGFEGARVPDSGEIEAALSLVNWRDVVIDRENGTVFLKRPGMALDLGGIVKGYAADEALAIVIDEGVTGALVDLGGNIAVYGEKVGGGRTWRIGVQNPLAGRGEFTGIIEMEDGAAVTSGNYERFFEQDGARYHHILSTATGYPAESGVISVTVSLARRGAQGADGWAATDADALSTTLFVLGLEAGLSFISGIEGAGAVFILPDGSARVTENLRPRFTLRSAAAG